MPWCSAGVRAGGWAAPRRGFRSATNECWSVVRLAGTVAHPIVVVAAPGQELPELPAGVTVVRDSVAGRGPLQGLAAGLAALPKSVELAYATATDVPFLEPRWIVRLAELIEGHDMVIPHLAGYYHPLAALYRGEVVLPAIERLLAENRLRTASLVESVAAPRRRRSRNEGRRPRVGDAPEPESSRRLPGGTRAGPIQARR